MNVLIVNHKKSQCGIYQYGINLYNCLTSDLKNKYFYIEANNFEELLNFLNINTIDIIVFNWHSVTMPWVNNNLTHNLRAYSLFFIYHDHDIPMFDNSKTLINDPTKNVDNKKTFNLERFLFENNYKKENQEIIISTFGFGFGDKGFSKLINKVNEEFENVTIRIHTPTATVVDSNNILRNRTLEDCQQQITSKNKVIFTHEYKDHENLLKWLSESTLNCFLYDNKPSHGISSCIDYALSVDVPLAITECEMFRHILNDEISVEKKSLKYIIENGLNSLNPYKIKWNKKNFIERFNNIITNK